MRKKYKGPISKRALLLVSKEAWLAYKTLGEMRRRSRQMGIKCDLDSREFIHWNLKERKRLNLKHPSVSRFDHSKGYTWDNFCLEEKSANSREAIIRNNITKHVMKRVQILDARDGSVLMTCPSITEAAKNTKMCVSYVNAIVQKNIKATRFKRKYFDFKFAEAS